QNSIILSKWPALMQNSRLGDYDVQPPVNLEFNALGPPAYSSAASRHNVPEAQSGKLIGEFPRSGIIITTVISTS
ncbi:MAG TPA: hypothetical protein VJJ98_08060, partial [Sedimentisphaerales bacterium]|nr:hypothetical protein [Sedimentisphaerales bacterium]